MMYKKITLFCLLLYIIPYMYAQESCIEKTGDAIQIIMPLGSGLVSVLDNSEDKAWLQFGLTFGTSWLSTQVLKRTINKKRPNGGDYGFPSGHTTAAFSSAAFMQKRYGWKYGLPGYLLASYVGWTRIHADKHDIWDVMAGAAIGTISAQIFTKRYPLGESELNIHFSHIGLSLQLDF